MIPKAGGDGPPRHDPDADPPLSAPESAPPPKLRDAALILPLFGAFLLVPPLTDLFVGPVRIAGIPLIVLYIFGVWLGLILAALWLAGRLRAHGAGNALPRPGTESRAQDALSGPRPAGGGDDLRQGGG